MCIALISNDVGRGNKSIERNLQKGDVSLSAELEVVT